MLRAVWNGVVLAETERTVRLEGNHYAAWYYQHPSPLARRIRNHVAFWNGVRVEGRPEPRPDSEGGPVRWWHKLVGYTG